MAKTKQRNAGKAASKQNASKGARPQNPEVSVGRGGEIIAELRKVIWPTWPELVRMTGIVIATVIIFGMIIGLADLLLSYAVKPLYTPSNTVKTVQTTPTPQAPAK